jgi:hypothetical protein
MPLQTSLGALDISRTVFDWGEIGRGRLALLTRVFIDDSADQRKEKFVLAAGLLGTHGEWSRFNKQWKATLHQSPAIRYWHSKEWRSLSGEFAQFRDPVKYPKPEGGKAADRKRSALVNVLEGSPVRAVVVAVLAKDYERMRGRHIEARKYFRDDLYECALQSVVYECSVEVRDSDPSPCVAFVSDTSSRSEVYARVYAGFLERNPKIAQIMRGLVHLDDKKWPGLQAADLVAHVVNQQFARWDGVTQVARPLPELNDTICKIAY